MLTVNNMTNPQLVRPPLAATTQWTTRPALPYCKARYEAWHEDKLTYQAQNLNH